MNNLSNLVDQILDEVNIVDEISKYTNLKAKSNNLVGLCLFHEDTKPSLTVSPQKKIFKCFSCGVGGNVINFYRKQNNVTFVEALKKLSEIYNIDTKGLDLNNKKVDYYTEQDKAFFLLNDKVKDIFNYNLHIERPKNKDLNKFLQTRKITKQTVDAFMLGYAKKNEIIEILKKSEIDLDLILKTNVISAYEDKYVAFFKDRLIFPIFNIDNYVVGFIGRTISDDSIKYLNIRESKYFKKNELLYNINKAYTSAEDTLIITEGLMDTIAFSKAGYQKSVGLMGVELSSSSITKLKRIKFKKIVLAMDNDNAGILATFKILKKIFVTFKHLNLEISIVDWGNYKDADDFFNAFGFEKFTDNIKKTKSFVLFFLEKRKYNAEKAINKKQDIINDILTVIGLVSNSISKNLYLNELSLLTNISLDELKKDLGEVTVKNPVVEKKHNTDFILKDNSIIELNVIFWLLKHEKKFKLVSYWFSPKTKFLKLLYEDIVRSQMNKEKFSNDYLNEFLEKHIEQIIVHEIKNKLAKMQNNLIFDNEDYIKTLQLKFMALKYDKLIKLFESEIVKLAIINDDSQYILNYNYTEVKKAYVFWKALFKQNLLR